MRLPPVGCRSLHAAHRADEEVDVTSGWSHLADAVDVLESEDGRLRRVPLDRHEYQVHQAGRESESSSGSGVHTAGHTDRQEQRERKHAVSDGVAMVIGSMAAARSRSWRATPASTALPTAVVT